MTPDLLREFFGSTLGISQQDLLLENQVLYFGMPPSRIDFLTGISGVEFEQCWKHRNIWTGLGFAVNIIGLSDLRANKLASGRLKDLADLEELPQN